MNDCEVPVHPSDPVHEFWFGSDSDDLAVAKAKSALWWSKKEESDETIRRRFEALTQAAARGELEDWADAPRSLLCLLLLTDQFPRNMYRGSPRAFATDSVAQRHCLAGLEEDMDRMLRPIERVFFYMPLQHAESRPLQEQAVRRFEQLFYEVPDAHASQFQGFLSFAFLHRRIIERYGRFPHRNAILERSSTPEEIAFLKEPGSSF